MMASATGSGAEEELGGGAGKAIGDTGAGACRAEIRPCFSAHWMRGFMGGLLSLRKLRALEGRAALIDRRSGLCSADGRRAFAA
jgi:hypothetical protein